MINKNILLVIFVVALFGFYFVFSNKTATAPENTLTPIEQASANTITLDLEPAVNSTQSGQAILTEVDGKTKVTLQLMLSPIDTPQPAHIHVGNCPEVGAVKYPLTNVVNGRSETTIDVSLETLLTELPLAINVHKSVPDAKTYVSCGDIIR